MAKKEQTVTLPRKVFNDIKALARAELNDLREGARTVTDRKRRNEWIQTEGVFKAKRSEEIQTIQNRSAIRSAGVGALLAFLANWDQIKNSETVQKHWWVLPLAVLALGWFLKRKGYKDAPAILTVGGVLLVQAYQNYEAKEKAKKAAAQNTAPPQQPATTPSGSNVAGFADTGSLHLIGDYGWLQDAQGRWIKVSLPPTLRALLPQYAGHHSLPSANANTAGPTQEDYEAAQHLANAAFAA